MSSVPHASVHVETPVQPGSPSAGLSRSVAALANQSFPLPADHEPLDPSAHVAASFKESTSFSPEVVEQLVKTNPGVLVWLRSGTGLVFQALLILFYILVETVSGLLISYSLKPNPPPKFKPMPSSIIVMNSGLSVAIGVLITYGRSVFLERTNCMRAIPKTFGAVFEWRPVLSFAFVAALFNVSAVFTMLAYSKMDAGLKKILDQLRLPITAAMGTVITGKKYSMHEWLALLIVLLAVCSFYFADVEHDEITELHTKCRYPQHCFHEPTYDICAVRVDGPTILGAAIKNGTRHDIQTFPVKASKTDFQGLSFSVVATFLNCIAALFAEKLMKGAASTPFPTQKAQMETTGFPVAIAMSFIVPLFIDSKGGSAIWWAKNESEGSGAGFFQGYTGVTWIAISLEIVRAWMGGLIVKQFSALVQKIAKCIILLLTVFCAGTFFKACQAEPLPVTMYALAFVTAFATTLFASMPKDNKPAAAHPPQVMPEREVSASNGRTTASGTPLLDVQRR